MKSMYIPTDFVDLCTYVEGLRCEIRYATTHNLTGHVLAGYKVSKAIGTRQLGDALRKAIYYAQKAGHGLLIYDAYRPQKAVEDFVTWSKQPEDEVTKQEFYPYINKEDLFPMGYIAHRSGHSRGSVVDLTLTDSSGMPVDMGTGFDLMDESSHHGGIPSNTQATQNRELLKQIMIQAGFAPYENEWWHYRLINEPFPDTYFDFDIE